MTEVSVATWNLHQAVNKRPANMEATWGYLANHVHPTVALVQEADGVPGTPGGSFRERADDVRYETAVVAYRGRLEPLLAVATRHSAKTEFLLRPTVPATHAVARVVDLDGVEPFVAVSMYGRMAPIYAQVGVIRAIADLIPLFDSALRRRIVVGGDLNAYDQPKGPDRERWRAIFELFESLGLVNLLKETRLDRPPLEGCPCGEPECWHVETFRHVNHPVGKPGFWCTDYLFATRELADRLIPQNRVHPRLEIWDRAEAWALSDHCPLVARFDL